MQAIFYLYLVLIFVLTKTYAWQVATPINVQEAYIKCSEEMNGSSKIRKQWQSFKFPTKDTNKSPCFVRCLLKEMGLLERSRIHTVRLYQQVDPHLTKDRKKNFKEHIDGCINEFKGHSCDKIFKVFLCLQLGYKKEMTKAFKAPKKIPTHTEL